MAEALRELHGSLFLCSLKLLLSLCPLPRSSLYVTWSVPMTTSHSMTCQLHSHLTTRNSITPHILARASLPTHIHRLLLSSYSVCDCVISYMILDFMETDLHKIIYSKNELTDEHIQYFVYQILKGNTALHSYPVH